MKRLLQNLVAVAALLLVGVSANAQTDLSKMKIASISEAITTQPEAGKYYLLEQDRGNTMTPAGDTGEGGTITRASSADAVSVGDMASAVENYLLQFIPTGDVSAYGVGGVYILQWATGNYWVSIYGSSNGQDDAKITTTSDAGEAGIYNVYPTTTGGNLFGLNAFDMDKKVDNNGAGGEVVGWDSGLNEATSGNNVWTIYEVTFEEASNETLELQDLIAEAQAAYDANADVRNAQITSTEQFSSPYTDPDEGSLDDLLDGDASTYWHSNWHGGSVDNGIHYIQVDLADDFVGGDLILSILRRNNANNQVVKMSIKDGEDNLIDTVDLPYEAQGETVEAEFNCPEGIYTLRFYNEGTVGYSQFEQGFFHLAGLQLYTVTPGLNTENPEVAEVLAEAIAAAEAAIEGDATAADIATLQDALDYYLANIEGTEEKPVIEDGEYLIVNQEGNYLGGGLTWGTQAAIIGKPQFIGFEVQSDGTYHLDSHQYNGEAAHYLGSNLYFDNASPVDWTIEAVDGGYTIYGTVDDGTGYLTSNGFQTVPTVEASPYVWTLVTMDDVVASMDDASADNPVDVTALIAFPEMKRNSDTEFYPMWTITGYDDEDVPNNYAFGGGSAVANCAESWHSTNGFNFSQEITLPKAGKYTLSAQGFWRDDESSTLLLPVMYAGNKTSTFPEITRTDEYLGVADNMANAYQEFLLGLHPIDAITITAAEDGETVTIGFKGEDTSLWNIMGELALTYSGPAPIEVEPVYVEVHECEAEIDHWTTTGNNGTHELNTWSVEADESGMVTPFCQNWIASGNVLTDATISHTQLTGLEAGSYEVTLDVRIFSEAGNDIEAGSTLSANGVSVGLVEAGTATTYNASKVVYGTYTLQCEVDENGTLDIAIDVKDATFNWIAWKNLTVSYLSTEMQTFIPVEGKMNAEVEATMNAAIAAYNSNPTAANYYAAVDAIAAAEASVAYYAPIEEVVEALDEAGTAVWQESQYAAMYDAGTLTSEDVSADLAAAVVAQTTAGSDMTYAITTAGTWIGQTGTYADGMERYGDEIAVEDGEVVKVLYQSLEGLTPGTYEVSFYAVANNAWVGAAVGDGIAQVFANDVVEDVTVYDQTGCTPTDYPHTIQCTVGEDGTLEFGLQNIATGGNWYVCQAISLTLVEAAGAEEEDLSELIAQYEAALAAATEAVEGAESRLGETPAEDEVEEVEEWKATLAEYTLDTTTATKEEMEEAIPVLEALAEAANSFTTAISGISAEEGNDVIYTISGTRVSKAVKGVYIINGKKVLVK